MSKQFLFKLIAISSSILISLFIIEFALRLVPVHFLAYKWPAGYYVSDPECGYRMARNFPESIIVGPGGTKNLCFTNSLELRDVEVPPDQDPQYTIMVLGNSMTYGWGAMDVQETWPRLLDQQIKRDYPSYGQYHVINAGVCGYNTFQKVALLEQLLPEIRPGVALLAFYSGIWNRNTYGKGGKFGVIGDTIMTHSFKDNLLDIPDRILGTKTFDGIHQALLSKSRLYFMISVEVVHHMDSNQPLREYQDMKVANQDVLKYLKDVCLSNGIKPIVTYLPAVEMFKDEAKNADAVHNIKETCDDLGLIFIDPFANMKAEGGITAYNAVATLTYTHDLHYNRHGNSIYVRALTPLLIEYLEKPDEAAGQ